MESKTRNNTTWKPGLQQRHLSPRLFLTNKSVSTWTGNNRRRQSMRHFKKKAVSPAHIAPQTVSF